MNTLSRRDMIMLIRDYLYNKIAKKYEDEYTLGELSHTLKYSYNNDRVTMKFFNYTIQIALDKKFRYFTIILDEYTDFGYQDYDYKVYNLDEVYDIIDYLFDNKIGSPPLAV